MILFIKIYLRHFTFTTIINNYTAIVITSAIGTHGAPNTATIGAVVLISFQVMPAELICLIWKQFPWNALPAFFFALQMCPDQGCQRICFPTNNCTDY